MPLRDLVKRSVRSVVDRFSGEYSAAQTEIRPDDPAATRVEGGQDVKVTRARLKRPPGQPE
jgi:hypothetical protein